MQETPPTKEAEEENVPSLVEATWKILWPGTVMPPRPSLSTAGGRKPRDRC